MELLGVGQPAPELIWAIVSRGVGLCFLVAFLSLRPQVIVIAGRDGVLPIDEVLRAQARDFSSWRRFVYFPTLLWINSSDLMLRALTWLGILGSLAALVGGPQAPWAFVACFAAYLSLDRAMTLIYPWDSMLLEAGFWAAFLPATQLLPDFACVAAPSAPAAWAFRLLAFRVLFGFGKHKFIGSTPNDKGFLRGFLASQPLPNPIGWYAQKLPMALLKIGLIGLFFSEIVAPFAVFLPGPIASIAALMSIGLMVGIWATGNYGHFNLVLIVVVVSWFDHATARQLSLTSLATPVGALFAVHSLLALFAVPFNTFCSFTWVMWGPWRRLRNPLLAWPLGLARWVMPFRIVHPYGVFPPTAPPAARFCPVTEVTWDGVDWHELQHPYWPTREDSAPRFCAPHHERFDQAVVYEGLGLNEMTIYRGGIGRWDPYGYGGVAAPLRFIQRILAGTLPGDRFYDRSQERQRGAPQQVRVRLHLLEPVSLREHAATGKWWTRTLIGPHFPPQRLEAIDVTHPVPPPELWHFEDMYWLERSDLGRAVKRVADGEDPHRLISDRAPELRAEIVEQFWSELVPWVSARERSSSAGLRQDVMTLRARYDRERLYAFERLVGRYGAFLFAKLEPLFNRDSLVDTMQLKPTALGVRSLYALHLLAHQIIAEGRAAYDAVIADPSSVKSWAEQASMAKGHSFLSLFKYEALVYQSQKLRLVDSMSKIGGRNPLTEKQQLARANQEEVAKRGFGANEVSEFLMTQFLEPEHVVDVPERYPRWQYTAEAEIVKVTAVRDEVVTLPGELSREP